MINIPSPEFDGPHQRNGIRGCDSGHRDLPASPRTSLRSVIEKEVTP
jgi:hypothetical protein